MSSITGTTLSGGWILYRYGWQGFITKNWKLFFVRGLMILFGAYYTLNAMWLKFLIIWRFFRLWALLDDVEVPENMKR